MREIIPGRFLGHLYTTGPLLVFTRDLFLFEHRGLMVYAGISKVG